MGARIWGHMGTWGGEIGSIDMGMWGGMGIWGRGGTYGDLWGDGGDMGGRLGA